MPSSNLPLEPQKSIAGSSANEGGDDLKALATGRRFVNTCLFGWLAGATFQVLESPLAGPFLLAALVASLIGVSQLAPRLGFSSGRQLLIGLSMFVPLLNLLVMGWLGTRASKVLKEANYSVGLLVANARREA